MIEDLLNGTLGSEEVMALISTIINVVVLGIIGVVTTKVKSSFEKSGDNLNQTNTEFKKAIEKKLDDVVAQIENSNKKINSNVINLLSKLNLSAQDLRQMLTNLDRSVVDENVLNTIENRIDQIIEQEKEQLIAVENEKQENIKTLEELLEKEV